jgi:hypothetical protein
MCNLVVIFPGVLSLSDLVHPKNQNPPKNQGRIMDIFSFQGAEINTKCTKISSTTGLRRILEDILTPGDGEIFEPARQDQ